MMELEKFRNWIYSIFGVKQYCFYNFHKETFNFNTQ
jgi:hypothetical protein